MDVLIATGKNKQFGHSSVRFCPDLVSPIVLVFFLPIFLAAFPAAARSIWSTGHVQFCPTSEKEIDNRCNFTGSLGASKACKVWMVEFQGVETLLPRVGVVAPATGAGDGCHTGAQGRGPNS